jgi:hypothetical protein
MSSAKPDKVVLILAQILMQAAGLNVESLSEPATYAAARWSAVLCSADGSAPRTAAAQQGITNRQTPSEPDKSSGNVNLTVAA